MGDIVLTKCPKCNSGRCELMSGVWGLGTLEVAVRCVECHVGTYGTFIAPQYSRQAVERAQKAAAREWSDMWWTRERVLEFAASVNALDLAKEFEAGYDI